MESDNYLSYWHSRPLVQELMLMIWHLSKKYVIFKNVQKVTGVKSLNENSLLA